MIKCWGRDGNLEFGVRVVTRSARSEIVGEHDGALKVRIAAPPVAGAANQELIRLLMRELNVRRAAIDITAGLTSKIKQVRIKGLGPDVLARWNS